MVKDKPKNKGNDKILTVIFVIAILTGFYLVSLVDANFENEKDNVLLYESDSSANFLTLDSSLVNEWGLTTTGVYESLGSEYQTYAKIPVYLGNNSWTFSVNETIDTSSFAYYVIELPNMDDWLITNITYSMNKQSALEMELFVRIFSLETPNVIIATDKGIEVLHSPTFGSVAEWKNNTIDINLATALEIHDIAQDGTQYYLLYVIRDTGGTSGLDSMSWDMSTVITGKQIATYNIVQQMELVLVIAIIFNVVVIIFMTDEIDIGGFVNDIPDKKRR